MMLHSFEPALSVVDPAGDACEPMFLERRGGVRVKLVRNVKVHEPTTGRHLAARTRDISATGMRLEMPLTNAIREGEHVTVYLGSLSEVGLVKTRRPTLAARVVWVKRDANRLVRPILTAGVEFVADSDAQVNVA
ncbi:MAG: PilZ domain-containing protein [Tepidisphaeraceae bacterium]